MSDVVERALAEDLGDGDLTTRAVVPEGARAQARIEQKEPGVIAGLSVAREVFARVDPELEFESHCPEGHWRESGAVAQITGSAASILGAERVFGFGSERRAEEPYAELLADGGPGRVLDLEHPLDG